MALLCKTEKIINKPIAVLTIAVIFCIVLGNFVYFQLLSYRVVSTTPKDQEKNHPLSAPIVIEFNRAVSQEIISKIAIETSSPLKPTFEVNSDSRSVTFTPVLNRGFYPDTVYALTIPNANPFGRINKTNRISFTTEFGDPDVYDKVISSKELTKTTDLFEEGKVKGFEFMTSLPIQNDYFVIEGVDTTGRMGERYVFDVIYLKTRTESEKYLKEWLSGRGIDLSRVIINPILKTQDNGYE